MNANLKKITNKEMSDMTPIEYAIWYIATGGTMDDAEKAADQYAELTKQQENRAELEALKAVEKIARQITDVVESGCVVRLAKPCHHGNYATAPMNHPWFCDDCWIDMQNALTEYNQIKDGGEK